MQPILSAIKKTTKRFIFSSLQIWDKDKKQREKRRNVFRDCKISDTQWGCWRCEGEIERKRNASRCQQASLLTGEDDSQARALSLHLHRFQTTMVPDRSGANIHASAGVKVADTAAAAVQSLLASPACDKAWTGRAHVSTLIVSAFDTAVTNHRSPPCGRHLAVYPSASICVGSEFKINKEQSFFFFFFFEDM